MSMTILLLGFVFGSILQFAGLNKFNVISGLAVRENFTVAKAIALAIGVGAILLNSEIALGMASYHVKPFIAGGLILGGLIFGAGMAILGYCPGTLAISLGEGSLDAFFGIIGGLLAGWMYTLLQPSLQPFLGPDLGVMSLHSWLGSGPLFFILLFIIGAVFIVAAFILQKFDKDKNRKWIVSGIALAILNAIIFSTAVANRPIGASSTYPYLADLLTGLTDNAYFIKIKTAGHWELFFLAGALLAGLAISLTKRDFKFMLLHQNWITYKGSSAAGRIIWSLSGGFIMIFGARMAGGCTSGHVVSGGMQLALSSLTFAVFVFAGLLLTGQVFYKRGKITAN